MLNTIYIIDHMLTLLDAMRACVIRVWVDMCRHKFMAFLRALLDTHHKHPLPFLHVSVPHARIDAWLC